MADELWETLLTPNDREFAYKTEQLGYQGDTLNDIARKYWRSILANELPELVIDDNRVEAAVRDIDSNTRTLLNSLFLQRNALGSTIETVEGSKSRTNAAIQTAKDFAATLAFGNELVASDAAISTFISSNASAISEQGDARWGKGTMAKFPKLPGDLDDTERLQRAIDYYFAQGLSLDLEGATYITRQLNVPAGLSIYGNGATLRRPKLSAAPYNMTEAQMKWVRMMVISHSGPDDSAKSTIDGIEFDGTAADQWFGAPNYNQEQASMLFISSVGPGKSVVAVSNCHLRDSVSDGIHVVRNAIVTISSITTKDCFRGGVVITGGQTEVTVDGWISRSTTPSMPDGLDIEIDSLGYDGSRDVDIVISNVILDRDFDVAVPETGSVRISNLIMRYSGVFLHCGGGSLSISDSIIRTDAATRFYVSREGNVAKISNSTVYGDPASSAMQFSFLSNPKGSVELDGVNFATGLHGIGGGWAREGLDFAVRNCTFGATLDIGVGAPDGSTAFAPATLTLDGNTFKNFGDWFRAERIETSVYLSGNKVTNPLNTGFRTFRNTVTFLGENLLEHGVTHNIINGGYRSVVGNRQLIVTQDPNTYGTNGLPGSAGAIAIMKSPSLVDSGTGIVARRWEWAEFDSRPGLFRHRWKELPTKSVAGGATSRRPAAPAEFQEFFDSSLGRPIWCKTPGVREVDTLTVTTGASSGGNVTISLGGVTFTVALTVEDNTLAEVAAKIGAATFAGWYTSVSDNVVTFSRENQGTVTAPVFNGGTTGAVADFVVTAAGTAPVWVDSAGTTV